jgi:hypothetical protein
VCRKSCCCTTPRTYGERTLTLRGDTLMFRRLQYPQHALIPLNDSTFALETVERITIERGTEERPACFAWCGRTVKR